MKTFEEKLERLEEINRSIRNSEIPLEKAITNFEEGIQLAAELEKSLGKIERKIEILVNQPESPEEKPHLELFPDLGE